MSEEGCIAAADIKHYAYCEGVIYVKYVLGIEEPLTEYMKFGREVEKEKNLGFIMAKLRASKVLKNPYMRSKELKLCGSPDYVIITKSGELIPVEIKWAEPDDHESVRRNHALQLAAYALLLEKTYSGGRYSVKRGYVYYLRPQGKLIKVNIDYSLKLEVLTILKRIKEIVEGLREPKPSLSKCSSCNLHRFCPYQNSRNTK